VCRQAAPRADASCSADEHLPATEHFNVIWAYVTLAHSTPSDYLTHLCCHALHGLPNFSPQDISYTIWVVAALKHINRVHVSSALLCFVSTWVVSVAFNGRPGPDCMYVLPA